MPSSSASRSSTAKSRAGAAGRQRRAGARAAPARRRSRRRGAPRSIGRWLLKWTAVLAIWGVVALGAVIAYFAYDLPSIDGAALQTRRPAVTVLANDGAAIARYGDLAGDAVTADTLPE